MRPVHLFVAVLAAGVASIAATNAVPSNTVFRVEGLPFEVTHAAKAPRMRHTSNRTVRYEEQVAVSIGGGEPHTVSLKAEKKSIAAGGQMTLSVTDTNTGKPSQFAYDPATSTLTVATGTASAAVTRDPTGSYSIDGRPMGSAWAAIHTLKDLPAYHDADPHAILAMYAEMEQRLPEVKDGAQNCQPPPQPPSMKKQIGPVLDCAACEAAGRLSQCPSCPPQ